MANTKSAQKAMRQAERRAVSNRAARSAVRTYAKKATAAVANGIEDAAAVVREAVRALDKAAQKGIVHRNNAARRKSRLMSRLHQLSLGGTATVAPAETKTKAAPKTAAKRTPAKGASATADKKPAATATATATAVRKPAAPRKPAAKKT